MISSQLRHDQFFSHQRKAGKFQNTFLGWISHCDGYIVIVYIGRLEVYTVEKGHRGTVFLCPFIKLSLKKVYHCRKDFANSFCTHFLLWILIKTPHWSLAFLFFLWNWSLYNYTLFIRMSICLLSLNVLKFFWFWTKDYSYIIQW